MVGSESQNIDYTQRDPYDQYMCTFIFIIMWEGVSHVADSAKWDQPLVRMRRDCTILIHTTMNTKREIKSYA
ncbi:MAG: hypothetical protein MJE68_33585, partial [Proteobacteria bacterium]|nr:hypothetical protein [Pseudomonadota bacterium]